MISEPSAISGAMTALGECRQIPSATPSLKTLKTLVGNIVKDPKEEKFHSIKLTNPKIKERLCATPQSITLLKSLGFVEADGVLRIPAESIDVVAFTRVLKALQEAVEARDGMLKREPLAAKSIHANATKKRPKVTLSLKQQANADREEREKKERASRLAEKQLQLKQIAADKHARKHDPNWKSGVSAAAGKGGKDIKTFRDKFGEGGGS